MSIWDEKIWRSAAVLTPVDAGGEVDGGRLAAHCRELATRGIDIATLFGTTGEGPAFSVGQRVRAVEAVIGHGYPAERIVLGIGATALADMVELAKAAHGLGLGGVLATPPFYFKDASQEGLRAAFARLIEGAGASCPPVMLYHIPSFTGLPLSPDLLARLAADFPGVVRGIKDSGDDVGNTFRLIERCPDLVILAGIERHLPDVMAKGGRGTICGWANIEPAIVNRLLDGDRSALPQLASLERLFEGRHFLGVFKNLLAAQKGDPAWLNVLPPLEPLQEKLSLKNAA